MPISGKQAIKILEKHGFRVSRQKGSHVVLHKIENTQKKIVVVPVHKELKKGTLRSIANQASISVHELGL